MRAEAIGDAVVGGVVTRVGALDRVVEETDVSVLARLDLRPVFVGVSAEAVSARNRRKHGVLSRSAAPSRGGV